jgi:hypothetical protein
VNEASQQARWPPLGSIFKAWALNDGHLLTVARNLGMISWSPFTAIYSTAQMENEVESINSKTLSGDAVQFLEFIHSPVCDRPGSLADAVAAFCCYEDLRRLYGADLS